MSRARLRRIKISLTPGEWRRAGATVAVVAGLHAVGFFILLIDGAISHALLEHSATPARRAKRLAELAVSAKSRRRSPSK